jgi:hypothetical protein
MRVRRTRAGRLGKLLLSAGLALSLPQSLGASERSELLVARGQVAYHRGRFEEARALFAEALASDPTDAAARYQLGLALRALGRPDEEAPAAALTPPDTPETAMAPLAPPPGRKRWSIYAATGVQYDSNVTIAPGGQIGEEFGDRADFGFVLSGGGRYDLLDRSNALVRVEYDLYQTLHVSLTDFNFRAHHVRGTASYALRPSVWAGVQAGYHHYTLGPHSYLSEPSVLPFVSILEGSWGLTQVSYRYGNDTYLSQPFHEVRDGPTNAAGFDQTLYAPDGKRYLAMGYQYGSENPTSSAGDDFQLRYNQVYAGAGFPAWWQTAVDLMYLYRYDNYTKPNSVTDFRTRRHDSTHYFYASVARPVLPHVDVVVAYFGTIDFSNISLYTYHRNVVSAALEVTY